MRFTASAHLPRKRRFNANERAPGSGFSVLQPELGGDEVYNYLLS